MGRYSVGVLRDFIASHFLVGGDWGRENQPHAHQYRLEVVFTGGCTAAINLVAYSYGSLLKPGDRIILSELEHHSNIVPWQLLRQRSGIEIDVVPVTGLGPGLTITGGRAQVDATLAGLLAARERITAALLAQIETAIEPGRDAGRSSPA